MCLVASNFDLHWAAGFIDADGCVTKNTSISITADQKDREPLDKLVSIFGGSVYRYTKTEGTYHRWYLYADKAALVMKLLSPLLSKRRQDYIDELLQFHSERKVRSNHNIIKTHCPKGHAYSGDNLKIKKSGGRDCRECQRSASRNYYYKTRKGT